MNDSITQQRQQLQELLGSSQGVGVVLTPNQSMDSVAAALSIALILQDSGKNSQIVSNKEPIVEYSGLVGIDQIRNNFTGSTKIFTVSFPYKDGEIEKVSYNIEGDRLNVNLFSEEGGINFSEKDIKYIRQGTSPGVIVTIGISDLSELEGLINLAEVKIINIDNKVSNSQHGDVVITDPTYSSLSEIVAKIAEALQLQIEFDTAQNLLDGIMSATGNFTSPKTSPLAFEMAGMLMQKGAIRRVQKVENKYTDTSLQMLGAKSFSQFQGKSQGQNQQKTFKAQKVFGMDQSGQKQFISQNFPKQNPFKKQPFAHKQIKQHTQSFNMQNSRSDETAFQTQDEYPDSLEDTFQKKRVEEIKSQLRNMPSPRTPEEIQEEPQIPTEDQAPSDWFTPKVFKSNKN